MLPADAVVPVKTGARAKLRLAHVLGAGARNLLVESLLRHVIGVLGEAGLRVTCVRSGDLGWTGGADVMRQHGPGLNAAVREGLADTGTPAVVVAADMPWITAESVIRLTREPGDVVVAATRDGGTGALLLRRSLPPAFGPRSALRHAQVARQAGLWARVVSIPGLDRDLDDEPALAAALATAPGMDAQLRDQLRGSRR
ncbi:MAG TPA: 2-phospho-L-lactate guanylyltransferase [Actinomycetota bacterium]|nr:2-phospho-L-lactate guanylyltransferase [Actinomycetota bacterium]